MTSVQEILASKKGPPIISVAPEDLVFDALSKMAREDISAVLVLAEDRLVGIFTERDYARKVALQGRSSKDSRIGDLMTPNPVTIAPSQSVDDVMNIMTGKRFRHLPVVDNGRLLGIVTIGDAVKAVIDQQQQTIRHLSGYIAGDLVAGETAA